MRFGWRRDEISVLEDAGASGLDAHRRGFTQLRDLIRQGAHGLYDLRHTYATIALSEGKPPTYVAEQIGDSVETLHRWYAHWFPRRRTVTKPLTPEQSAPCSLIEVKWTGER